MNGLATGKSYKGDLAHFRAVVHPKEAVVSASRDSLLGIQSRRFFRRAIRMLARWMTAQSLQVKYLKRRSWFFHLSG
jgi:hypothetical protein